MSESTARQVPWFRILVEGLVIVVSILLAFGIEAWWDGAVEQRELVSDLANVRLELESNLNAVNGQLILLPRINDASQHVASLIRSSPTESTLLLADSLVWLVSAFPVIDPVLGAVDALVSSGRLASVRDSRLRAILAGLRARLDDVADEELAARALYFDYLYPSVQEVVPVSAWAWIGIEYFDGYPRDQPLPTRTSVAFPASVAAAQAMEFRSYLHEILVDDLGEISGDLETGLALLQD